MLASEDHWAITIAKLVANTMLLFFLQNSTVPENSGAGVTVLIGKEGSLGGVLAWWVALILAGERALFHEWYGAMPTNIAQVFLDAHGWLD